MQLKPLDAARYEDNYIVIRNPENGMQELFTESEFEIVRFLKKNESQSLLALLLPNIGIAKKDHIVVCLKVLGKLKRLQIVDYFTITGRQPASATATLEIETEKKKLELPGFGSVVSSLFALGERSLSWMGPYLVLLLSLGLAAFSFLFFPFEQVNVSLLGEGFSYSLFFLLSYLTVCGALSFRSLLQAVFLRSLGRVTDSHGLDFYPPFLSLYCRKRDINLAGFQSRIQMGILGLVAPLMFSALFTGLWIMGAISLSTAFFGFSASVLATLLLASPFLPGDLADILHVLFLREELKERISGDLRNIFHTKGSLSREMLFALLASLVWLLVWLDCLRVFWESLAEVVTSDAFAPSTLSLQVGAWSTISLLVALAVAPAGVFVWGYLREKFGSSRRKLVVRKDKVKESLSFEERMAALEKIPLFAYLNNQERLSLLNEMSPVYYPSREFLVHQGEVGHDFFVLVKGHCNAYFTDLQGKNYFLADLSEGDAFGEIALIDDVPRTASIVSDGGCVVLVLKKEGFERFAATLGSPDRVKAMIRLTSFFRRHPLFSKLGVKDQAILIDSFRFETLLAGDEVPVGDGRFFLVYSGQVRVDVGDDNGEVMLDADDCFGYETVLNARYFAAGGAGLLSVTQEDFEKLIWEKLVERPELFI